MKEMSLVICKIKTCSLFIGIIFGIFLLITDCYAGINTKDPTSNSGSWTAGGNAYSSNDSYASSLTDNATHDYGDYGFSGSGDITKVEVGIEAYISTASRKHVDIQVSTDGGLGWSDPFPSIAYGSDPDTVEWIDVTSHEATWTWTKLNNTNFKVQIIGHKTGGPPGSIEAHVDYLPARVTYSEAPTLSVVLRNASDTGDYISWALGSGKELDTVCIMNTNECVLVKNDGSVPEDFSISATGTNWILGSSTGEDTCVLMGLFNADTAPAEGNFSTTYDIVDGTTRWATVSAGDGNYEGTNDGDNVAVDSGEKLYIYLKTPFSLTQGDEEAITVTVGCREH